MFQKIGALILGTAIATAALPPKYQNAGDLNVMTDYIKDHEQVISLLKSIDFRKHIVYYGDCKIIFGRKESKRAAGILGPVPALEFKREICANPNARKGKI